MVSLPRILFALAVQTAAFCGLAQAADRIVEPGQGTLQSAILKAEAGDHLLLQPGDYRGAVIIDRPLELDGSNKARVIGPHKGTVITVEAANVTIRNLTVTGSGLRLDTLDSGIKLLKKAKNTKVLGNRILDNLVGVDVHGARKALVARNLIEGRQDLRLNDRGNGVYVWNAPGLVVEDNIIRFGRDGIFANTSRKNIFRNNHFSELRFAVHYMYTNDGVVTGNVSVGNHIGYALMFSSRLKVEGNQSIGDRDHGIMLNYANDADVKGNLVRNGGTKCLFLYNANRNDLIGNRFEGCPTGVHFTAGSERNTLSGNAFIRNRTQVKYVGSRWLDWSRDGEGNYWSDHPAYDLDSDGIADNVYRPNDVVDQLLWTQPSAKLLLGSPAMQLIRWSQSRFPALLPGGVYDPSPLMRPVELTGLRKEPSHD
ncbi:nitrous oxide reductase family maturation protein NosD [Coralliovum pocilloporae]|uniref:nitrous oxide reductase family maturation protein NosD n=1 Tax=Coralliovum pocilloporae TaxID=3066369 RepID=UPI003306EB37